MRFNVPDMSCAHCTAAITKEITALDPTAKVTPDLEQRTLSVETARDTGAITAAIRAAGYEATLL